MRKNELPENYEELRRSTNRAANWRERMDAIDEMGQWKHPKIVDVLTGVMKNDPVYKVQDAAYRTLKKMGEKVEAPERKKGEPIKGVNKILLRIKKSLPEEQTYEEFKEKVKKMRLDVYDTYEGNKGTDFDKWLEHTWEELNK